MIGDNEVIVVQLQSPTAAPRSARSRILGRSERRSLRPQDATALGRGTPWWLPNVAVPPPQPTARCFPSASPTMARRPGKQKAAPKDRSKPMISLRKSGAGEGIRTLDPNLGKVVLYP